MFPLPAVLAVTADAALPRIPGMREILAAGKKPTTDWSLDDLGPSAVADRSSRVMTTFARRGADPPAGPLRGHRRREPPANSPEGSDKKSVV